MPKQTKIKKMTRQQELLMLAKSRELIVGALTLVVIALFVVGFGIRSFSLNSSKVAPKKETTSTFVTPVPSFKSAMPKSSPVPSIGKIEKLSYTSSDMDVVIKEGDSYWKIAKRICGNGKIYKFIGDDNLNKPLFKGDFVKVICSY